MKSCDKKLPSVNGSVRIPTGLRGVEGVASGTFQKDVTIGPASQKSVVTPRDSVNTLWMCELIARIQSSMYLFNMHRLIVRCNLENDVMMT